MSTLISRIALMFLPMLLIAQEPGNVSPAKVSNNGNALASTGTRIPAQITVKDNVNIEATLLPPEVAKRVFGKNISDTYASILINVSNRSNEATLLLHSVFLDYSAWGFGGLQRTAPRNCIAPPLKASGLARNAELEDWQAGVSTCEVSSVEYRIVRGQMLQAQPWTLRNVTVRGLEMLGTIASGYATFGSADVARFMTAYNGVGVPALDKFWVDDTVGQLNRISDMGFRNDKAIPQEASDIIVAFFPLDRFLTPLMKRIYFQSPALFFHPLMMLLDPTVLNGKYLGPVLERAFGSQKEQELKCALKVLAEAPADPELFRVPEMTEAQEARLTAQEKEERDKQRETYAKAKTEMNNWMLNVSKNKLINFVQSLSLSRVQLVISGSMTIDVDALAASISDFECQEQGGDLWGAPGTKHCVIRGKYLAGGRPVFPDAATLGLSDVQVDETASSASELRFTLRLKGPIDSLGSLRVRVTKSSAKGGKQIDSNELAVSISYTVGVPTITKAELNASGDHVLVTGSNFHGGMKVPLSVFLGEKPLVPDEWTPTTLSLPIKDVIAGTYDLTVENARGRSEKHQINIHAAATPAAEAKP